MARTKNRNVLRAVAGAGLASLLVAGPAFAADNNAKTAAEKQTALAQGNAATAGTVQDFKGGTLTITPFGQSSAGTVSVPSSVPVFQGNGKVTTSALMKGVNVRVHYNTPVPGQAPTATAVEVLSQQEANAAKGQAQPSLASNAPATPTPVTPTPVTPAPGTTTPAPSTTPLGQLSANEQQQKQQVIAQASGSQPGKVKEVKGDQLVIDPYQKAAGNATLTMASNVPIYQANGQVGSQALQPGTDVRVYYKSQPGQRPSVVAVQILDPSQAKQLEKSERDIPRGK